MAVTETIQELLQGIDDAQYGRDMRQYIHKGIQKCYEEGSAGETDLEARERLDTLESDLADINNWYLIPCDVEEGIQGLSLEVYAKINPTLKLMELDLAIICELGIPHYDTHIVRNLPIIKCHENDMKASNRYIPLVGDKTTTTSNVHTVDYADLRACDNTGNVGEEYTYTQSRVYFSLPEMGQNDRQFRLVGHIVVPYTALSPAHPMSEAVLIEN